MGYFFHTAKMKNAKRQFKRVRKKERQDQSLEAVVEEYEVGFLKSYGVRSLVIKLVVGVAILTNSIRLWQSVSVKPEVFLIYGIIPAFFGVLLLMHPVVSWEKHQKLKAFEKATNTLEEEEVFE